MNDILEFLAETLKQPSESLSEVLFKKSEDGQFTTELLPDAKARLLALDTTRIEQIRASVDTKKIAADQYNRGKKEALETLEKGVREKYGIESDATGIALIDNVVATAAKSDLPDDKVKRHPLYLALEKAKVDDVSALTQKYEAEKAEIETGYKRKEILTTVRQTALQELEALKPIFPSNGDIANNLKGLYASQFDQYEFEQVETGGLLILKNGERQNDQKSGLPLTIKDLAAKVASGLFEFQKQDPKGSAGNKTPEGGDASAKGWNGAIPSTVEDFQSTYYALTDPGQRSALAQAFEAAKRAG